MSLQFSDTTNKRGIVELIDANVNSNSVSYPIEQKTRDVNLALDRVLALIFQVGGTWQFDDSNHVDYAIITTNLVSGQRDYSFVVDGIGNLILEVQNVMVANQNGVYHEISPVDVGSGKAPSSFYDGLNTTGTPYTYDKTGTGIFLNPPSSYNYTNGLKVYISREGSYFTTSDTVKKPGFAGLFHEYLALRPSYQYAYRKGLKSAPAFEKEMIKMEQDIQEYYKSRQKDVIKKIWPLKRNPR